MACTLNLFDDLLGGTPGAGGTWVLTTATPNPVVSAPFNFILNGIPTALSAGSTLIAPGTSNIDIDVSDTPRGSYVFTYTVAGAGIGCSASATVTINVVAGAVAGTDVSFQLCNTTNQAYILYDLVSGGVIPPSGPATPGTQPISTTGSWSGSTSSSGYTANAGPTLSTFNPNGLTPGTYTFIYTVNQGGSANCPNCTDTATVTFVIVATPDAGANNSVTLCNDDPV